MKLAASLLALGLALIAYAAFLPPYKDRERFEQQYRQLTAGQSARYYALRQEMITPKYQLEDYGGTAIALALAVFLFTRSGRLRVESPASCKTLVAIGIGLPFLTVVSFVSDLFLSFSRGEYPHWGDSMGIPLMGAPVVLVLALVWSMAHLCFLRGVDYSPTSLIRALSPKANWWLLCISLGTALLALDSLVFGQFCYVIPCALWLYLYLSLAAVRRAGQGDERTAGEPPSAA